MCWCCGVGSSRFSPCSAGFSTSRRRWRSASGPRWAASRVGPRLVGMAFAAWGGRDKRGSDLAAVPIVVVAGIVRPLAKHLHDWRCRRALASGGARGVAQRVSSPFATGARWAGIAFLAPATVAAFWATAFGAVSVWDATSAARRSRKSLHRPYISELPVAGAGYAVERWPRGAGAQICGGQRFGRMARPFPAGRLLMLTLTATCSSRPGSSCGLSSCRDGSGSSSRAWRRSPRTLRRRARHAGAVDPTDDRGGARSSRAAQCASPRVTIDGRCSRRLAAAVARLHRRGRVRR